jgi:hypothetical protein
MTKRSFFTVLAVILLLSATTLLCACNGESPTPEELDAAKTVNGILSKLETVANAEFDSSDIFQTIPSFAISDVETDSRKEDTVISFYDNTLYLSSDGKNADTILKSYEHGFLRIYTKNGFSVEDIPTYSSDSSSQRLNETIAALRIEDGDLKETDTESVYEFSTQYLTKIAKALDISSDEANITKSPRSFLI